ncbi:MAG: hypothetical protein ACR2HH_00225 [Chthoniobacterales bacterium]
MIEATASKSFAEEAVDPPGLGGNSAAHAPDRSLHVITWLNLVCLDAPIVAVSWQWLFARSFGIPIAPGGALALFLTAWLIYLADRFGDSLSVRDHAAVSRRQSFCRRHRVAWLGALGVITMADLFVIFLRLKLETLALGAVVGAVASVYLLLNQAAPWLWRRLPLKEVAIGTLFAAGTMVALAPGLTSAVGAGWILFAALCALNCISIAVWERELDHGQGRVSIATAFPKIRRAVLPALVLLALVSLGFAGSETGRRDLFLCLALSGGLLSAVHFFRNKISADVATALADLVLLTPLIACFVHAFT